MGDLIIPSAILQGIQITPSELLVEIAVHLYDTERLTMGQAKKLAGLTQIEFQKELAKRNVCIKYDVQDWEKDMANLSILD